MSAGCGVVPFPMLILTHRRFRSEVHRLVDGELAAEWVEALNSHLMVCEGCRGDLGWWLAIRAALRREWTSRAQGTDHY